MDALRLQPLPFKDSGELMMVQLKASDLEGVTRGPSRSQSRERLVLLTGCVNLANLMLSPRALASNASSRSASPACVPVAQPALPRCLHGPAVNNLGTALALRMDVSDADSIMTMFGVIEVCRRFVPDMAR